MTTPPRPYSVHPATRMAQDWVSALPSKTGKTLDDWRVIIRDAKIAERKELIDYLKREWQFGTNQAIWLADIAQGNEDSIAMSSEAGYLAVAESWIQNQYAGKKEHLRPVYNHILTVAMNIGEDVNACPTKTYTSLFRHYAFGQIKPTTNSRIDLGLALGAEPPLGKLIETGGAAKGDRITHRIALTTIDDIDDEVHHWLQMAYQMDE